MIEDLAEPRTTMSHGPQTAWKRPARTHLGKPHTWFLFFGLLVFYSWTNAQAPVLPVTGPAAMLRMHPPTFPFQVKPRVQPEVSSLEGRFLLPFHSQEKLPTIIKNGRFGARRG